MKPTQPEIVITALITIEARATTTKATIQNVLKSEYNQYIVTLTYPRPSSYQIKTKESKAILKPKSGQCNILILILISI